MGWIIIIILVGLLTTVFTISMMEDIFDSFFTVLITCAILVIIGSGLSFIPKTVNEPVEKAETIYIQALKDNSLTEGSFFLGTGDIDERHYYFYLEKSEKGAQMKKQEIASNVYVNEDMNGTPRIEVYSKEYVSPVADFFFGALNMQREYIFHVPKGTITNEFKVDME